jgi:hypothetical protein
MLTELVSSWFLVVGCSSPPPAPVDPCALPLPEAADACRMVQLEALPGFPLRVDDELWRARCDAMQTSAFRDACGYFRVTGAMKRSPSVDRASLVNRIMEGCAPMVDPVDRGQCTFDVMMGEPRKLELLDPATWTRLCMGPAGAIAVHCVGHGVDNWLASMRGQDGATAWFSQQQLEAQVAALGRASTGGDLHAIEQLVTLVQALLLREGGDIQSMERAGLRPRDDVDFQARCAGLAGCEELMDLPELRWGEADMDPWWSPAGGVR